MKNNFALGVALGVIFPLLAYVATTFTTVQTSLFAHKPIALYVFAATINLIGVRFMYRKGKEATANGVVLVTFLAMIILLFTSRNSVFSYS